MGLEDLEVDQRVDLWRSRTRGFNQMPQHYNLVAATVGFQASTSR